MLKKFARLLMLLPDKRRSENGNEIHKTVVLPPEEKIELGSYIYVGPKTFFDAKGYISIGDGTIISSEVCILSSSHEVGDGSILPYSIRNEIGPVIIGKGCWIGIRAILMPGITLGDGVIVGAGSVVTKNFEDGSIVAGNPAKLLKKRVIHRDTLSNSQYLLNVYGKGRRS